MSMDNGRKTSNLINIVQYDETTGNIGLNGVPVSGYGAYLHTTNNDGSIGIDSSASINALYLLKNGTKNFEISYDTTSTKIFRLLPYQSTSFFQIGNPSNAGTDYVFISESTYGNVLIGPGLSNATGYITGATASIHKIQLHGAVFADSSIQASSFKITGGSSTGFLKADGTVDSTTYVTGNQSISITGDATGSGTTSIALTLANSGVTAGTYGSSTAVPVIVVDSKGRITSVSTSSISGSLTFTGDVTGTGTTGSTTTLTVTNSAVISKVLTGLSISGSGILATDSILTAFGKIQNQVNGLVGGIMYQGTWNASTNSPALSSGVGTKGYMYKVATAGTTTIDGVSQWNIGDMIVFDGTTWDKIDGIANEVVTVFGRTGTVTAQSGDYTTTLVTEGTNLYYTDARARAAHSLTTTGSSGAATYSSSTGVFNIPNYTLSGLGGEPAITAGTTSQYWRGDKTFQTLNTTAVAEGTNLYFTNARAQGAITLTTTGSSGAATYSGGTLNIPTYTLSGLGGQAALSGTGFVKISGSTISYDNSTYYLASNPNSYIALTALSATSPLSYNNTTGAFSITQATNATNGYLTSTDWTTFNNKQAALGGTGLVKSTAGSITYITDNSSTWNSGSTIANSLNGVSPINFNSITGAISISQATTSTNGYLSSTDWNTFNGKQAALNGTGFVKISGTTISYDNSTYLTGITSAQVTTALGYTPYNSTNPSGYLTGITSSQVTTALGFTPYNATNPSGYLTGITSSQVTTALGYTPYNSTNPSGYITSSALSSYLPLSGGTLTGNLYGTSTYFSGYSDVNPTTGAFRFYNGTTFTGGLGTGSWAGLGASNDIVMYLNSVNYYISNQSTQIFKITSAGAATFSGHITTGASSGFTSSQKDISGGLLVTGSGMSVTQNDDTFYPLISNYNIVSGQGYYNYPAFGFMRPTTNINGDAVISNRGDGLATVYWKFKPNGDLTIQGSFNGSGAGLTGTASSLTAGSANGLGSEAYYDQSSSPKSYMLQSNGGGAGIYMVPSSNFLSTSGGTISGSLTITGDSNLEMYKSQTIDMSGSAYSTSNYYPVMIGVSTNGATIQIQCNLNTNVPSWSNHPAGFTLNLKWSTTGSGWGVTAVQRVIHQYNEGFNNATICGGITQMSTSSQEVVWLRGGGVYNFIYSRNLSAFSSSTTYTNPYNTESVTPTSSAQNNVWSSASHPIGVSNVYATSEIVTSYRFRTPNMSMGYWDGANNRLEADSTRPMLITSYGSYLALGMSGSANLTINSSGNVSLSGWMRMGQFNNSQTNGGEAWIGRASDRQVGIMTVQLGNNSSSRFEVVDYGWSVVLFRADGNGNCTASGDITAYSDKRVKENIVRIDSALDKVKAINGYYYNRTDIADKTKKIGFIAQEVLNVVPEIVNYDNKEDRYSISYGNTAALLVEAIKEQQGQIEDLKKQIEYLVENK